jgi:vitamin B12/bleomycin/antimicrobial peptide transport system ATP-binding/permease protein
VGLASLAGRLDETVRWDHALSNGELQRLAIARILVQKPDIVIFDEALGALDDASLADLMQALEDELPNAIVLSFTQSPDRTAATHIDLTAPRRVTPDRTREPLPA